MYREVCAGRIARLPQIVVKNRDCRIADVLFAVPKLYIQRARLDLVSLTCNAVGKLGKGCPNQQGAADKQGKPAGQQRSLCVFALHVPFLPKCSSRRFWICFVRFLLYCAWNNFIIHRFFPFAIPGIPSERDFYQADKNGRRGKCACHLLCRLSKTANQCRNPIGDCHHNNTGQQYAADDGGQGMLNPHVDGVGNKGAGPGSSARQGNPHKN